MSKANRLSITNRARSKDALSNDAELGMYDDICLKMTLARAQIYTSHSALMASVEMESSPLFRAVAECLYHAWTQLDEVVEDVDRLNSARMWRLKVAEKAHA